MKKGIKNDETYGNAVRFTENKEVTNIVFINYDLENNIIEGMVVSDF
jgi:hypothetical protein